MPGWRDRRPARPSHSWRGAFALTHPILAENAFALSKPARDVVFGSFVAGLRKNRFCFIEFHEPAHYEKSRAFRNPRCLLHVVRDDDYRVLLFELVDQVYD